MGLPRSGWPPRPESPTSSQSSFTSSLSSHYSLLPLRTFQRLHLIQFALTFLFLFVVPVVVVVVLAHQLRWEAFLLGTASWLASEQLREVVFELFTPASPGSAPATDLHNMVAYEEADLFPVEEPLPPAPRSHHQDHPAEHRLALPTVVHALAQEALRLGAVVLVVKLLPIAPASTPTPLSLLFRATGDEHSRNGGLQHGPHSRPPLPPLDPLFWSALWLALGSAMTEILWGSRRLWKQLELYGDVLPCYTVEDEEGVLRGVARARASGAMDGIRCDQAHHGGEQAVQREDGQTGGPAYRTVECCAGASDGDLALRVGQYDDHDDDDEEEEDLAEAEAFQRRLRAQQRDELEAQLGVPLIEIPPGVVLIWRLDSILLSLIFTLLLSLPFRLTPPSLITFRLAPTFAFAALAHAALSYAWVARVRQWGIPSVSYASLIVLVGMLFGTLGAWGVLV